MSQTSLSSLIWSVADLLRGDYKPHEYGRVILPFTVLRRLDCVLAPTKTAVLAELAAKEVLGINPQPFVERITGVPFANTSALDLRTLMGDQDNLAANLTAYIQGFSPAVRDVFERFLSAEQVVRLAKTGLLYKVTEKFAGFNLHPDAVNNHDMGLAFEELIRKFAEISNETAGEHFRRAPAPSASSPQPGTAMTLPPNATPKGRRSRSKNWPSASTRSTSRSGSRKRRRRAIAASSSERFCQRSAGIVSPRSLGPTSQSSTTTCATSPTRPIAASK